MIHLTPQQLSSYMDGELNEASTELVRRHLGLCEECTLTFGALEEQEDHLARALVHDPGDDFFDRFAADVARQLPHGKDSSSKPSSSSAAGRAAAVREAMASRDTMASHEAMASRDTTAPIVQAMTESAELIPVSDFSSFDSTPTDDEDSISAELFAPSSKPFATSSERDVVSDHFAEVSPPTAARKRASARTPVSRQKVRRPTLAIPWFAALILALISGAAGVVVSRTEPVTRWLDSCGPQPAKSHTEEPAGVAPSGDAVPPNRGVQPTPSDPTSQHADLTTNDHAPGDIADDETQDAPEPEPQSAERFLSSDQGVRSPDVSASKDAYASLSQSQLAQVRTAQRSKAAADANPSAVRYEAAAAAWEQTVAFLHGAPQSQARLEIASARYRAWDVSPTSSRASAAAAAIRAYVASAPQGPAREQARNWLARISQ